ncbi:hypothetical protein ACFJIV_20465 [Mucilaginibacter sp. UC70_90]
MSKKVFHKQNAAEAKKLDKSPIDKLLGDLEITVEKEVRIGKKVANDRQNLLKISFANHESVLCG